MRVAPVLFAAMLIFSPMFTGGSLGQDRGASPAHVAPETNPAAASPFPSAASPFDGEPPRVEGTNASAAATENETRVLAIPPGATENSELTEYGIDLGPGVEFGTKASTAKIETYAVEERIAAANTTMERRQRIRSALRDINASAKQLRDRERAAIEAYAAGDIGGRELLIRLASVHAQAEVLTTRLNVLTEAADETEGFSLDSSRVAELQFRLRTFEGPVRKRTVEVLRGEAPPTRVHVAAGSDSVVLSTIVDGTYVREAYRGDRMRNASGDIDPEVAANTVAESYPTIWQTRARNNTDGVGSGSTFIFNVPHERGRLVTYVSGGIEEVSKEVQYRPTTSYEGRPSVSNEMNGLRLVVNRTFPGGPLRVHVETQDGEPVSNATVNVDLQNGSAPVVVGTTDEDGNLWTLSPRNEFTLTAIKGQSQAVFLRLSPTPPPAINESRRAEDRRKTAEFGG